MDFTASNVGMNKPQVTLNSFKSKIDNYILT